MRHEQGGAVRLARESSPAAETIRPPVSLADGNHGSRHSHSYPTEVQGLRAVRPPRANPVRRRTQWTAAAAWLLAADAAAASSVIAWGAATGNAVLVAVALGWALTQALGVAISHSGRKAVSIRETGKRAQAAGVVLLGLVGLGWAARSEVLWFAGLVAISLGLRGLAMAVNRRQEVATRTMVVGRSHELPAALDGLSDGGSEVSTYSISDADPLTRGEHLHRAILEFGPNRIVLLPGTLKSRELQELSWAVEEYDIEVVVALTDGSLSHSRLMSMSDGNVAGVRLAPRGGLLGEQALGLAHRAGAALLLVALAPVMLAVAVLVRLDSNGPALFVQNRVGRRGVEFPMVKFRTMHTNAEEMLAELAEQNESEGGVLFKMKGDPRITGIGRVLRATSLDELPQLFNVVRGEMNLIGPRPALPREVAEYDRRARRRLAVRPGLTGLWQVSGRSDLSFEDAVRLDIEYVDNWSFGREVEIAFRTVGAVVRREGAY